MSAIRDEAAKTPCDPVIVAKVQAFAETLGIRMRVYRQRWVNECLPGILVWRGGLSVNPSAMRRYDDVLHELGHLAVLPSVIRPYASGDVVLSTEPFTKSWIDTHQFILENGEEEPVSRAILQSGESEAIAWSYAAQVHLGLLPKLTVVMQDGDSLMWRTATANEIAAEIACLSVGAHFGVHGLAAAGMTTKGMFPKMIRWVQP